MSTVSRANAVFTLYNIISVPQSNRSPHAENNEVGYVSSARVPSLFLKVLAILTVCCWIVSSSPFKRLNGVAKAAEILIAKVWDGGHSFQFEFREYLWCWNTPMASQNLSPSFHLWEKSSDNCLSKNGSWKKVFLVEEMFVASLEKHCYLAD